MTDCNVDTTVDRMPMTGTVVGYDPGGNGKHGFARATVRDGEIVCVTTKTLQTAEDVVRSILGGEKPLGLGVDTLTCWSTGRSGWRPADCWLRQRYPAVKKAIVAPNSLFGAMSVNGMAVLLTVRQAFPGIFVTETHPKVLYYALVQTALRLQRPKHIRHERPPELMARRQGRTSERARVGRRHLDSPGRPWTQWVMAGPTHSADQVRRTSGAAVRQDDLHVARTKPHPAYRLAAKFLQDQLGSRLATLGVVGLRVFTILLGYRPVFAHIADDARLLIPARAAMELIATATASSWPAKFSGVVGECIIDIFLGVR